MSAAGKNNQYLKLYGITKLRTDVIFMADIRLKSRNLVSCDNDVEQMFLHNPYGSYASYFNSNNNKRGVGIFIKKNLNVSVLTSRSDPEENYLLLEISIAGNIYVLGSIYGPNSTNRSFFENLERDLQSFNTDKIILAGDWNCTMSAENIRNNIDCLNMVNVPNRTHTLLLNELCDRLNLIDPYRATNPEKREYTYVPRAAGANNRSRIDFFLISAGIVSLSMECKILPNLQNKLFDHRAVTLDYRKKTTMGSLNKRADNAILKDDIIDLIIFSACAEAYAIHSSPAALPVQEQREVLRKVGTIKTIIRNAGPPVIPVSELIRDGGTQFSEHRDTLLRKAELCKDDINLPHLQSMEIDPDPEIFLETLTGMIKNDLISYQYFAKKQKNLLIDKLKSELTTLKNTVNQDTDQIIMLEKKTG
jgi:exonuclease III